MRVRAAATFHLVLAGALAGCADSPTQPPEIAVPLPIASLVELLDDPIVGGVLAGLEDVAAGETIRDAVVVLADAAAHGGRAAVAEAITAAAQAREGYAAATGPSSTDAVRLAALDLVLIRAHQLLMTPAAGS